METAELLYAVGKSNVSLEAGDVTSSFAADGVEMSGGRFCQLKVIFVSLSR